MEEEKKRNKREKKEKEKKRRKNESGKKIRPWGKSSRERRQKKKKKREWHFPSRSPANRRSKHIGVRDKVGPCNESYAWVSKSEFFIEALRGRGFLLYWFFFI